jgi:hypothetical protein
MSVPLVEVKHMTTDVREELMLKREEKSTKHKDWEESLRRSKDYNLRITASEKEMSGTRSFRIRKNFVD